MSRPLRIRRQGWGAAERSAYGGRYYQSKKEASYAAHLDLLRASASLKERVIEWVPQFKVPLDVNGVHICNYYVDFLVTFADGRQEYHEVKGFETDVWRMKRRLFEAIYPDRKFVVRR